MKRGIKQIVPGVILLILGIVVIPVIAFLPLLTEDKSEVQFKAPGTIETTVDKPGRYYVWNDYNTFYQGKVYQRSKALPDGFEVRVRDDKDAPIPFEADTSTSYRSGSNAKQSIGYIEMATPGRVKIEVSGGDEERIISFSQFHLSRMFVRLGAGAGVSLVLAACGMVLLVWGIVKVSTRR